MATVDIPVPRGDLQGFLPGQGSTASSSHSPDAENEAGVGVFSHFSPWEKSAASAAIPSPIVPASVSSWTRAAYEDLDAADELAELEDDAGPLVEEEEDPSGWSVAPSASGRPFFWHRISRRAVWKLPPGASVRKKKGRKKRKKRRKRRTPRSPRPLLRARARRRQRQWHLSGFPCDVSPRAVFPSVDDRPEMLGIMAGLDQKDFGMCKASGLSPFSALSDSVRIHALRQSTRPLVGRPAARSASWPAWTRLTVSVVLLVIVLLALCSLSVFTPKMLGILVDMDQKDSYGDVSNDCALTLLGVVLEFIAFCALTGAGWFRQCRNCGVRSWCCPSLSLFTAVSAAAMVSQMSWTTCISGDCVEILCLLCPGECGARFQALKCSGYYSANVVRGVASFGAVLTLRSGRVRFQDLASWTRLLTCPCWPRHGLSSSSWLW